MRNLYTVYNLGAATYDERLSFLGLTRLELRRLHTDLVFMFNYVGKFVLCDTLHAADLNTNTWY